MANLFNMKVINLYDYFTIFMPDDVTVSGKDIVFQCKLQVNNQQRMIYLYRKPNGSSWFMTVINEASSVCVG